jgi:hypothetical protein
MASTTVLLLSWLLLPWLLLKLLRLCNNYLIYFFLIAVAPRTGTLRLAINELILLVFRKFDTEMSVRLVSNIDL